MVWSWECSTETWGQGSETKRQKLSYNPALSVKYICSVFSNSISMHWSYWIYSSLKGALSPFTICNICFGCPQNVFVKFPLKISRIILLYHFENAYFEWKQKHRFHACLFKCKWAAAPPPPFPAFKVQGLFIRHIINYTGYNQKRNVNQIRSAQWTVQKNKN